MDGTDLLIRWADDFRKILNDKKIIEKFGKDFFLMNLFVNYP